MLLIYLLHIQFLGCISGYLLTKAFKRSFLHDRQGFCLCIVPCLSQEISPTFSVHFQFLILDKVFHMVLSCVHLLFLAVLDSICYCFPFHLALLSDPKAPWPALALINLRLVKSLVKISILLLVPIPDD